MDKNVKKILKYFMDQGKARGQVVEAHVIKSDLKIKEKDIGDILGSCLGRDYLKVSHNSKDAKHSQYWLTPEGIKAMDNETDNEKRSKYVKVSIVLIVFGILVTVAVGFQDKIFTLFQT